MIYDSYMLAHNGTDGKVFCALFEGSAEKGRGRIAQEQEEEGPGLRGDKRTEKRREVALTRGRRGAINYVTQ